MEQLGLSCVENIQKAGLSASGGDGRGSMVVRCGGSILGCSAWPVRTY